MPLWLLSAPVCCRTSSPDEAEAVIAHEISHIANGDMVTMTLIQGVVNTFVIFISVFWRSLPRVLWAEIVMKVKRATATR